MPPSSGQSRIEAERLVLTVHTYVVESGVVLINTHIVTNAILPKHNHNMHPSVLQCEHQETMKESQMKTLKVR